MSYDTLRTSPDGSTVYSGMRIGRAHDWHYTDALWNETKVAPDRWRIQLRSRKQRMTNAPEHSGALVGTEYHWYILAHQRVRKLDANAYATLLEGLKYRIGHRRPHWRKWNYEYPDTTPLHERLENVFRDAEARVLNDPAVGA